MPVATIFENLEAGSDLDEIIEQFHVKREQVQEVLEFAARSLDAPSQLPPVRPSRPMRIPFDHGTPSGIIRSLAGHAVTEAPGAGRGKINEL